MRHALLVAYTLESLGTDAHGTGIAPYYGVPHGLAVLVYGYEAVHLIGYAYGSYLRHVMGGRHLRDSVTEIVPPRLGILLGPALLLRYYGSLYFRIGG